MHSERHHEDLIGRIDSLLEILIMQGHARIRLDTVTHAAVGSPDPARVGYKADGTPDTR